MRGGTPVEILETGGQAGGKTPGKPGKNPEKALD